MAELLVALAPLLVLFALALLALLVPFQALAGAALALMLVGFVIGVPTGLYYHVLLRRELAARGPLPRGWYWRPQEHQRALDGPAVRRLRPWFVAGGLGFLLIMTGFGLAVTSLALWNRAERVVLP